MRKTIYTTVTYFVDHPTEEDAQKGLAALERICKDHGGITLDTDGDPGTVRYHFVQPGTWVTNQYDKVENVWREITAMMYSKRFANDRLVKATRDHYKQEGIIEELTGEITRHTDS